MFVWQIWADWLLRLVAPPAPPAPVPPVPPPPVRPAWATEETTRFQERPWTLGQRTCYGTTGWNERR